MHAFFSSTDWNNVYDRIGTPPIRPKVSVNSSLPYYHFMFYLLTHDTQSKEMVLISIILLSHSLDVTLFFLLFQFCQIAHVMTSIQTMLITWQHKVMFYNLLVTLLLRFMPKSIELAKIGCTKVLQPKMVAKNFVSKIPYFSSRHENNSHTQQAYYQYCLVFEEN